MNKLSLLAAVIIGGAFYVGGQYVASEPNRIEQEIEADRHITVSGRGTVQTRPDIAQVTLGMSTGPQKDAETALRLLSDRFERVVEAVKDSGVNEEDITTSNLSIRPLYDFRDGEQILRGYEASESIVVKIRDLDSIGSVVAKTTVEGVNQVGGISFTIDEPDALQEEAQEKAIEDAKENAKKLAGALGVRLGDVKSFSASVGGVQPEPVFARAELAAVSEDFAGPPVESGSQDVVTNVQITYLIR